MLYDGIILSSGVYVPCVFMKILMAVFKDLWNFSFGRLFGSFKYSLADERPPNIIFNVEDIEVDSFSPKPLFREDKIQNVLVGEVGYIFTPRASLRQRPMMTFDNVLRKLNYGCKVAVMGYEGRFAKVEVGNQSGYLLKDEVTTNYNEIFPKFTAGEIYLSHSEPAKQLRRLIDDEFSAEDLFLPLLEVEYIAYQIKLSNRFLPWGEERPRTAGNWHNLLKGQKGIHIGIEPKTGSIMEYFSEGIGRIVYVSAVNADETLTLLSVGRKIEGQYLEEKFSKKDWQKYRPVFTQVS